jgi:hypothetical protein
MDNQLLDDNLLNTTSDPERLELASQGARFGTFVIDRILYFLLSMVVAIAYFAVNPDAAATFDDNSVSGKLLDYGLGYIALFIY